MAHPIEEDQFDVSAFDAGVSSSKEIDPRSVNNYNSDGTLKPSLMLNPNSFPEEKFTKEGKRYYYTRTNKDGVVEPITGGGNPLELLRLNPHINRLWPKNKQGSTDWTPKDLAYPLNVPFGGGRQGDLSDWAFTNWLVNQAPSQLAAGKQTLNALKGKYFYRPPVKPPINVTPSNTNTTPKGTIPKYSSGAVVQTSEGPLYRPTERLSSTFAYTGSGSRNKPFIIKKGNKKDQTPLKVDLVNWVSEQMKKPEIRRPEDIDRRSLAIQYENGEQLGWLGMEKVFKGLQAGESPESLASHIKWRPKNVQSDADRIKLMSSEPVAGEVLEYAKTKYPEAQAIELVDKWKRSRMKGYKLTQEAARRQGLSLKQQYQEYLTDQKTPKSEKYETQYQAGHGKAVKSPLIHPDKPEGYEGLLYNAPTSGQTVRLEERTANISGGNKPEHDINPYAAKLIGWPDTWAADFDDFADSELNPGRPSQKRWSEHFNTKQIEKVFDIPSDWSEQKVKDYFKREVEPLQSKEQHIHPSDLDPMDPLDWEDILPAGYHTDDLVSQTQLDVALNGFAA